jgi:hypothetical protein
VNDVRPLLLEERVVVHVVRVDRVERGGAEHADVEVGVAEPVEGKKRRREGSRGGEEGREGRKERSVQEGRQEREEMETHH